MKMSKIMQRLFAVVVLCAMLAAGLTVLPENSAIAEQEEAGITETGTAAEAAGTEVAGTEAAEGETPETEAPVAEDEAEYYVMYAEGTAVIYSEAKEAEGLVVRKLEDGTAIKVRKHNTDWRGVLNGGFVLRKSLRGTPEKAAEVPAENAAAEPAAEEAAPETETAEEPVTEEAAPEAETAEEPAAEEAAPEAETEETETEETVTEEEVPETEAAEEPAAEEAAPEAETAEATVTEEPAAEEAAPETEAVGPVAESVSAEDGTAEEAPAEEDEDVVIIGEYETPLAGPAKETAYVFERDENGALVLDEKGNPLAIRASEEDDIPVAFLRDENGALVLDDEGNPVVTQTVPANAKLINSLEDELDPNRTIDLYYYWNDEKPSMGGEVTFVAVLYGYDNLEYTLQWQESSDNTNWHDVENANETTLRETITRDNYRDFWRVQVVITGVIDGE